MYQQRIIPCLLIHKQGLVKTIKFKNPVYVGDPLNAIRLFNEKEVDELIVLDIDASRENKEPNYNFIEDIASECFMPLCYGGGIKTIDQIRKIFSLGVEKVSLSSAALENPKLIIEASKIFGKQSIVVVIDVKKSILGKPLVYTYNGTKNNKKDAVVWAKEAQDLLGAGEIVINSIDQDGMMKGYDIELISKITKQIDTPVIALGGAGSLNDIKDVIHKADASAAAAGSLFVFTGIHKAVLINYPKRKEIEAILEPV